MERRKKSSPTQRTVSGAIRALLNQGIVTKANKMLGIYQNGWSANQAGQYRSFNPYPRDTPHWDEWNRGWIECSKVMKRRQSDLYKTPQAQPK